jgi:putative YphP/YqiW family bacilliredoxin
LRYDPAVVQPMRDELTRLGFEHLMTPEDVDAVMARRSGTMLVVVNSVCGCAAGMARPGVAMALEKSATRPDALVTVFAGMELDAVDRVRGYLEPYPPSSPLIALFKDGALVHMIERKDIEGCMPEEIAGDLALAFAEHCVSGA